MWKGREVVIVDHQAPRHSRMCVRQYPLSYVTPWHDRKDPDLAGGARLAIPPPYDDQRGRQLARETQARERPSTRTADAATRRRLNALDLSAELAALAGHVVYGSRRWKLNQSFRAVWAGNAVDYIRHSATTTLGVADSLAMTHRAIVIDRSDGSTV